MGSSLVSVMRTQRKRASSLLMRGACAGLVELAGEFAAAHAEDRGVEVDVLAPGELGVKAGADFEQAADAAAELDAAFGGRGDSADDLEERGFAGAIGADDADDFA